MTTLLPAMIQSTGPSPSRNPFARPKLPSADSFTRTALLPTHCSPQKGIRPDTHSTPTEKVRVEAANGLSGGKDRSRSWRLLWRGGLEIGKDGWRLDGIMFYAMLAFPPTPSGSTSTANPFDFMSPPLHTSNSPFSLPTSDTDLCLSLESMRGRKYLQVRGVTELPEDELLEGENDDGGVQVSINPKAPLLSGYLTGLLCRNDKLSKQGRTMNAIVLGLGDESADPTHDSTLLIYGQKLDVSDEAGSPTRLRLCVGRRKAPVPPPSVRKVKPGEPLPRALVFPTKLASKKLAHRPLSRANSAASIYAPPQVQQISRIPHIEPASRSQSTTSLLPSKQLPSAPLSGRTPGRRGEKRRRTQTDEDDERRRRSGKIVLEKHEGKPEVASLEQDEDIFGKRPATIKKISFGSSTAVGKMEDSMDEGSRDAPVEGGDPQSTSKKRARPPQQVLDNKATIRKQTLLLLESGGYPREHELFKDAFSMTTKGTYFAFRDRIETGPLDKFQVQRIVAIHLEMYLPTPTFSPISSTGATVETKMQSETTTETKIEYEETETLRSIKEEDEDEETLVDIQDIKTEGRP